MDSEQEQGTVNSYGPWAQSIVEQTASFSTINLQLHIY